MSSGMGGQDETAWLALEDVACVRGGRRLFAGLGLRLGAGGAALVTGPNGAGKSSLLRIVAGLLAPAAGKVERRGGLALANEAAGLDEAWPLGRALGFWAGLDGAAAGDLQAAMGAMGIAGLARVPVRMLSTGQRRRAVLARTIASGAPIWLLDEPANGLDAAALDHLARAMAAHRARGGIVVAASHQPIGLDAPEAVAL